MVIKKILCIVLLLILIVANVQICFADYDSTIFNYDVKNNNATNISLLNDNQNSNINSLYSNGYRSLISRYSQQLVHVKISTNIYFELNYYHSTGASLTLLYNYLNNLIINNPLYSYGGNSLIASNIDTSNLNISCGGVAEYQNYYYAPIFITGYFEFDMPLQNIQLIQNNGASNLNWSKLNLDIIPTNPVISGNTYQLFRIYMVDFIYNIAYTFPQTFSKVDGFYIFNEFTILNNENISNDITFSHNQNTIYYNGISLDTSDGSGVVSRVSLLYTLIDDSRLSFVSMRSKNVLRWSTYEYTYNDDYTLSVSFSVFAPLLYNNNSNFIQADSNGNATPLKLNYYDCEWYEIHLQLANAFIFMLTEFPLISDITNLIYSLFVMIKNSFDVLLNFNGFGILFGFGMFAIVFGFIYKLIVGD